jgi:hypothetical protein
MPKKAKKVLPQKLNHKSGNPKNKKKRKLFPVKIQIDLRFPSFIYLVFFSLLCFFGEICEKIVYCQDMAKYIGTQQSSILPPTKKNTKMRRYFLCLCM